MKISKLILLLQEQLTDRGDVDVITYLNGSSDFHEVESVFIQDACLWDESAPVIISINFE